ncbi:hypothetical protein D4Q52_08510 [Rhodopseudomonas palustris]|uniref:Uncharacterized protein n=1 Tax=Rhodopseudomonas palustris TaxID=1076 RepID=A0A418VI79_RHOPL|nr:hypothetical protein D4Q52_08510 [Rhodopseudomonas palustris]
MSQLCYRWEWLYDPVVVPPSNLKTSGRALPEVSWRYYIWKEVLAISFAATGDSAPMVEL